MTSAEAWLALAEPAQVDVVSDGKTVWVNDGYGCIGRFSKFGIDVHRSSRDQIAGQGECLDCTHERPDAAGWNRFVRGMLDHHGVTVGAEHMPTFCRAMASMEADHG